MPARLLLGVFAALRAVFIPGQAYLLAEQPLGWPRLTRARAPAVAADPREVAVELPAA